MTGQKNIIIKEWRFIPRLWLCVTFALVLLMATFDLHACSTYPSVDIWAGRSRSDAQSQGHNPDNPLYLCVGDTAWFYAIYDAYPDPCHYDVEWVFTYGDGSSDIFTSDWEDDEIYEYTTSHVYSSAITLRVCSVQAKRMHPDPSLRYTRTNDCLLKILEVAGFSCSGGQTVSQTLYDSAYVIFTGTGSTALDVIPNPTVTAVEISDLDSWRLDFKRPDEGGQGCSEVDKLQVSVARDAAYVGLMVVTCTAGSSHKTCAILVENESDWQSDSDEDDLLLWQEHLYGTNPDDDDYDNDGLKDGEEVLLGLDPTDADCDDDDLSDGDEVDTYVTNPLQADTDNDGIYDGLEAAFSIACDPDLDPTEPGDGLRNSDTDNYPDISEYLRGTNHLDGEVSPSGEIYVDDDATGMQNGSLANPFKYIRTAIMASIDGDTIIVRDGVYSGTGNRDLNYYGRSIIIRSENGPDNCSINCEGTESEPHRAFIFINGEDTDSVVEGISILNGFAAMDVWGTTTVYPGGGIYCRNASPTIRNCDISLCYAERGGAIAVKGSTHALIEDCYLHNNTTLFTGGGLLLNGDDAIYPDDTSPTVMNCVISHNTVGNGGGGIVSWNCQPSLINCTIQYNMAGNYGGALSCGLSDETVVRNCLITNNQAGKGGGLRFCYDVASGILVNNTICHNVAVIDGGGIFSESATLDIQNTILWGNIDPGSSGHELALKNNSNVTVSYCDVESGSDEVDIADSSLTWGDGNIEICPEFINSTSGWMSAEELGELNSDNPAIPYEHTSAPFVTSDGSRMYFHRWYSDTSYQQIFYADLNPITGLFENPQRVIITNEENNDLVGGPRISADGQRMYYHGASSLINGEKCIKLAQWVPSGESGYWEHVKDFDEIHYTGSQEAFVFLNEDESCLYFESSRPGGLGDLDIWTASRSLDPQNPDYTSPFSNPTNVTELNSNHVERSPQIMPDGLTMYFSSSRERSSSIHLDVYKATRSSGNDPFENLARLSLVGTPYENSVGRAFVTEDEQTIHFQGYRDESTTDLTSIYRSDYSEGDWRLMRISPCINAADKDYIPEPEETDIEGDHRIQDGRMDMGADEFTPTVWYVKASISQSGDGLSWNNAFKTLQEALNNSELQMYDHIYVAAGVYKPTEDDDRSKSFQLPEKVKLFGGFSEWSWGTSSLQDRRNYYKTILSGDIDGNSILDNGNSRHVVIGADQSLLDGFVIEMGYADGEGIDACGGGLLNADLLNSFHVCYCIFRQNFSAQYGGGMYLAGDLIEIDNCLIQSNTAGLKGGGLYIGNAERVNNRNCTIAFNQASENGGGLFADSSTGIYNTIIWGNTGNAVDEKFNQVLGGTTSEDIEVSYSLLQHFATIDDYDQIGDINNIYDPGETFTPFRINGYDGGDGWGNENDTLGDLRLNLMHNNPCVDAGNNSDVLNDMDDLDGDGIFHEKIPFDMDLYSDERLFDIYPIADTGMGDVPIVDLGVYESDTFVWYVDCDVPVSGNGRQWDEAFKTLQEALDNPDHVGLDQIWVAEGTYKPTDGYADPYDQTRSFIINGQWVYGGFKGIHPDGYETHISQRDWATNETILSGDLDNDGLDADNSMHVVIGPAWCSLDGFIIEMGYADGEGEDANGGGVYNNEYEFQLNRCVIRNNYAANHGGGIYVTGDDEFDYMNNGYVQAINCLLLENSAGNGGGGAYCDDHCLACFHNDTIAYNHAALGGGGLQTADNALCLCVCGSIVWGNTGNNSNLANQLFPDTFLGISPWSVHRSLIQYNTDSYYDDLIPDPGSSFTPFVGDTGGDGWDPEDFRLHQDSLCVDAGHNDHLVGSFEDLDGDGVIDSRDTWDLRRKTRRVDDPQIEDTGCCEPPIVDVGAYEYQPDEESENTPPVADLSATTDTSFQDCDGDGKVTNVVLNGAASHDDDPGDAITEYIWYEQIDEAWVLIPSTGEATLNLEFLAVGSHIFGLDVVDSHDAHAASLAQISIEVMANAAPVAKAGVPINVDDDDPIGVEPVTLNGSASTDDCAITAYYWYKGIDKIAEGAEPTVNLGVGEHVITLIVVDSGGLQSSDTVNVTVTANPITPPGTVLIDAGANRTILSPANKVNLTGSVVSGDAGIIGSVEWTLLSAPAGGNGCTFGAYDNTLPSGVGAYPETIIAVTDGQKSVTFPEGVYGSYVIQAVAKDTSGVVIPGADDFVQINIAPSPSGHVGPEVVAAITQSGTNSYELTLTGENYAVNLAGQVTDDGGPFGRLAARWQRISGPIGGVYFNQTEFTAAAPGLSLAADTTATFYKPGTYLLQLTGSDGDISTAEVVEVNVLEDGDPLTVSASLQEIVQGEPLQHEATIPFSAHATPIYGAITDGSCTSYGHKWVQIAGPAEVNFDNASELNTTVTFPKVGQYRLRLEATCGTLTRWDELNINVYGTNLLLGGGEDYTLIRLGDETVAACGDNCCGQLGVGDRDDRGSVVKVLKWNEDKTSIEPLTDIQAIASGWVHSLALDENGNVWSWGDNCDGELGIGSTDGDNSVAGHQIYMAATKVLAPDLDGDDLPDDLNGNEEADDFLGDDIPDDGGKDNHIVHISTGRSGGHSLAVDASGQMYAWGVNGDGQVGINEGGFYNAPFRKYPYYETLPHRIHAGAQDPQYDPCNPTFLSNIIMASGGAYHSLALEGLDENPMTDPKGRVLSWGYNRFVDVYPVSYERGLLGQGNTSYDDLFIPGFVMAGDQANYVPGGRADLADIVAISAGWHHSLALEKPYDGGYSKGRVYAWGYNGHGWYGFSDGSYIEKIKDCVGGRLGIETDSANYVQASPRVVAAGEQGHYYTEEENGGAMIDIIAISAGESHSMALDKHGRVFVWGDNTFGQLGNNTHVVLNPNYLVIENSKTPVQVVAPDLNWDGRPDDVNGNGIQDDYLSDIIAISAGYWHCVAMDKYGRVFSWGLNSSDIPDEDPWHYNLYSYNEHGRLGTGLYGSRYEREYCEHTTYEILPHQVPLDDEHRVVRLNHDGVATGTFKTIQDGINDEGTLSGYTLVVYPGIYNESLNVDKSLTIRSINPENPYNRPIINASGTDYYGFWKSVVCLPSDIVIERFVLEGLIIEGSDYGIFVSNLSLRNLIVNNCVIRRNLFCGICGNNTFSNLQVAINNCSFIENGRYGTDPDLDGERGGIRISYAVPSIIVRNSIFINNAEYAVNIEGNYAEICNNVVYNDVLGGGFWLRYFPDFIISHNTIVSTAYNSVYGSGNGIHVWDDGYSFPSEISHNIIVADDPIYWNYSEYDKIKYNRITDTNHTVEGNDEETFTLYGNTAGWPDFKQLKNISKIDPKYDPAYGNSDELFITNQPDYFNVGDLFIYNIEVGGDYDGRPRIITGKEGTDVSFYPPTPSYVGFNTPIFNYGSSTELFTCPHVNDVVSETTLAANSMIVADVSIYELGDVIEYNNDHIARMVNDIDDIGNVISFIPALTDVTQTTQGDTIIIWGQSENLLTMDLHLAEGSSCIDAGDAAFIPSPNETDIDGEDRVMGLKTDIGADEFQPWTVEAGSAIEDALSLNEAGEIEAVVELDEAEVLYRGAADPEGVTILWTIESEPDADNYPAELISPDKVKASLRFKVAGAYLLKLTVIDGSNNVLGSDTVTVQIRMGMVVRATPQRIEYKGAAVTSILSADLITRQEGFQPDHWLWTKPGFFVSLNDAAAPSPVATITRPNQYQFQAYALDTTGHILAEGEIWVDVVYPDVMVEAGDNMTVYPKIEEDGVCRARVNLGGQLIGANADDVAIEWSISEYAGQYANLDDDTKNTLVTSLTILARPGYEVEYDVLLMIADKTTGDYLGHDVVKITAKNHDNPDGFTGLLTFEYDEVQWDIPVNFPLALDMGATIKQYGHAFTDYKSAIWSWEGEGDVLTIDNLITLEDPDSQNPDATLTIARAGMYNLLLTVYDDQDNIIDVGGMAFNVSDVTFEITGLTSIVMTEMPIYESIITDPSDLVDRVDWSSISKDVIFETPTVHKSPSLPSFNGFTVDTGVTYQSSGQFPIVLSARDSTGTLLHQDTMLVTVTLPDYIVDAGDYPMVQLSGDPTAASMSLINNSILGEITGNEAHQWTKVSGPGSVTFNPSAEAEHPSAIFTDSGVYTLKYELLEGINPLGSDTTRIIVLPPDGASLVHAGSYRQVTLPETATLDDAVFFAGSVGVTPKWTKFSVDGIVTFSPNNTTEQPTVSFSLPGRYQLTLTAEGDLADPDAQSTVTIDVLAGNSLDETGPVFSNMDIEDNFDGTITVKVIATDHLSGVDHVTLKLDGDVLYTLNGDPYYTKTLNFSHILNKTRLPYGTCEISFIAVDICNNQAEPSVIEYNNTDQNNSNGIYDFHAIYDASEDEMEFSATIDSTIYPTVSSWTIMIYPVGNLSNSCGSLTGSGYQLSNVPLDVSEWNGTFTAKLFINTDLVNAKAELDFIVNHGVTAVPLADLVCFDPVPEEVNNVSLDIDEDHWQNHPETSPMPVINESIAKILGVATDNLYPDEVEFKIDIYAKEVEQYEGFYNYNWYNQFFIRNVSPAPLTAGWHKNHAGTAGAPASLGQIDLSGLDNGIYYMLLTVRCGQRVAHDHALFVLDCPLKLGNVQFSQEDVVVSVGNVPIRIVRTYDSFKKHKDGEFGHGWTYSIANMNIELDECRSDLLPDNIFDNYTGQNVRVGSNYDRNVTLTMPDGRRTTFLFKMKYISFNPEEAEWDYYLAEYESPSEVNASLRTLQDEKLVWNPYSDGRVWNEGITGSGFVQNPAMYDFSGYVLTTDDGVEYYLERETLTDNEYGIYDYFNFNKYGTAYAAVVRGPLYLNRIAMPSGEEVRLNVDLSTGRIGKDGDKGIEIKHADDQTTKGLEIFYDDSASGEAKRIRAINAPTEFGENPDDLGSTPTVLYEYDNYGNLKTVRKLVDKNAAPDDRYETIEYVYDDARYSPKDHYITDINDSRGMAPIRYEYDPAGRLIATIDGKGNRIEIDHDVTGKVETIYERWDTEKQYPTIYEYNERGNVTWTKKWELHGDGSHAVLQETKYTYYDPDYSDGADTVTQMVPDYSTSVPGDTVASITTTDFDTYGRATRTVDPVGNVTETAYDEHGNVVRSAHFVPNPENPMGNTIKIITVNTYNEENQMLIETLTAKVTAENDPGCSDDVYVAENFYQKTVNVYDGRNRLTETQQYDPDNPEQYTATTYSYVRDENDGDPAYITPDYAPTGSQPYRVMDVSGRKQYAEYDANGNQVYSYTQWIDPQGGQNKWIVTKNILDNQGRVTETKRCIFDNITTGCWDVGSAISLGNTKYNKLGQVEYSIDQNGILTWQLYDELGNTVETLVYESETAYTDNKNAYFTDETTTGILSISRTLYDVEGRVLVSVGPYDPAAFEASDSATWPVGTENVYDALGRVERTRRWAGVTIPLEVIYDNSPTPQIVGKRTPLGMRPDKAESAAVNIGWRVFNGLAYVKPVVGNELSYTRTVYDAAGWVRLSITLDEEGYEQPTGYAYDKAGRQLCVADAGDYGLNKATDYEASGTFYRLTAAKLQALLDTDIAGMTTAAKTEYVGPQRYSATDDNGHTTVFKYDEQGRVVRTQHPPTSYIDEDGQPQTDQALFSHVSYDGFGRKVWETGLVSFTDMPAEGSDNFNNYVKQYNYDAAGRLESVDLPDPENGVTGPGYRYYYDANGNQIGNLDPLNRLTVFAYDEFGRQTAQYMPFVVADPSTTLTDPLSVYNAIPANQLHTASLYNKFGRLVKAIDYKGQTTLFKYNALGRLEQKLYYATDPVAGIDPDTQSGQFYGVTPDESIVYGYDNLGRVEQEIWTDGTDTRTTTYAYDAEGRVLQMAGREGVINYAYNPITGQKTLAEALDVNEATIFAQTQYGYDGLGRLGEVTDAAPDSDLVHTYAYNNVGSRRQMILANDASPWYEYNAMNRLTRVAHHVSPYSGTGTEPAALNNFAYGHYADGMRATVTETMAESRTITYTYDNLNRLEQEKAVLSGTPPTAGYQADYTYDLAGNRMGRVVTANNGTLTTTYAYDPATDRLMTETNSGPIAQLNRGDKPIFAYADNNGEIYYKGGDGERIGSFKAFFMGLPSKLNRYLIWSMCGMLVLTLLLPLLMKLLAQLRRSPIPVGLPYRLSTRCIAMVLAFLMVFGPWEFQQLAQADTAYANISTLDWAKGGTTVNYTYDDNGSVLTKATSGSPGEVVTYAYNLQGRLAKVTTDDDPVSTTNELDIVEYRYNEAGIRIWQYAYKADQGVGTAKPGTEKTTLYIIDPSNPTGYAQAVAELVYNAADPDPATTPASVRSYTIGDDMIAQTDAVGDPAATKYLLYDGHGSTRQVINNAQAEVPNGSFSYDGYGMMLGGNPMEPEDTATNLLYTGEHYDTDAQNYYLRARWYDPSNGRLNRVDPYAGNSYDPQSLHKYTYCHNSPINGTDFSGMMCFADMLSALGLDNLLRSIKDSKSMLFKKGVRRTAEEMKEAFDFSEDNPIPAVAAAAEQMWVNRLRSLKLYVIPLQSTPIGSHGPDLVAFGYINGKVRIIVGEVKGMRSSRVLSSLDRLSDGVMQMSARWIDRYLSQIVNPLVDAIMSAACGYLPPSADELVEKALRNFQFDLYLFRARRYSASQWRLQGFRLIQIGSMDVALGDPLEHEIEDPWETTDIPGIPGL